jgi:hypothetical protein
MWTEQSTKSEGSIDAQGHCDPIFVEYNSTPEFVRVPLLLIESETCVVRQWALFQARLCKRSNVVEQMTKTCAS